MLILPETHRLGEKERIYWSYLRKERSGLSRQDAALNLAGLINARLSESGWEPSVEMHELN